MTMRCKFKLVTYVQGPLVTDRRGGTGRNLKRDSGWWPITDAGSRGRKAVAYERVECVSDHVI